MTTVVTDFLLQALQCSPRWCSRAARRPTWPPTLGPRRCSLVGSGTTWRTIRWGSKCGGSSPSSIWLFGISVYMVMLDGPVSNRHWGEYEGYCLAGLSGIYKILNTMNHTRTMHRMNKKLSLSKASYPVRRAGAAYGRRARRCDKTQETKPNKIQPHYRYITTQWTIWKDDIISIVVIRLTFSFWLIKIAVSFRFFRLINQTTIF